MPDCEKVLAHMGEFLDRRLSDAERKQVERHLAECEVCTQAFRWEDSVLRVCRDCAGEEVPPGLADRISECLSDE